MAELTPLEVLDRVKRFETKLKKIKDKITQVNGFAMGDQTTMIDLIPRNARERSGSFATKPKALSEITKVVYNEYLNGLSGLPFKSEVVGNIDFDLSPFMSNFDINEIQGLTEIAGTVAARPVITRNGISYELFTPDQIIVDSDANSGQMSGITIVYDIEDRDNQIIEHWTDFSRIFIQGNDVLLHDFNPWGRIPFIPFRAAKPPKKWFGKSELEVVVNNNIILNKALTDLVTLATDQSFAIYVLEGYEVGEEDRGSGEPDPNNEPLRLDTSGIMTVPTGAQLKAVTPNAQINEMVRYINEFTKTVRQDTFTPEIENDQYSSGFNLKARRLSYLRHMAKKRDTFSISMSRLFELAAQTQDIALQGEPRGMQSDFVIKTVFDDRELSPETLLDNILNDKHLISVNALSPIDIIMREQKVSREEAQEIFNTNKELNKDLDLGQRVSPIEKAALAD